MPELEVFASPEMAWRLAARRIAECLREWPDLVLGLATGRTMEGVYAELVRLHRDEGLGFAHCRTFNLDEYVGLKPADPGSYRHYMDRHLFGRVGIAAARTHVPDGMAADPEQEAARYEAEISRSGGIGLQLLGIGENGHIGFNEPMSPFASRTRVVELTPETRAQNAPMFARGGRIVPLRAITMGIATILDAREILLVATGTAKATALAAALHGAPDPARPASALQRHPRWVVIADEAAAVSLAAAPARPAQTIATPRSAGCRR